VFRGACIGDTLRFLLCLKPGVILVHTVRLRFHLNGGLDFRPEKTMIGLGVNGLFLCFDILGEGRALHLEHLDLTSVHSEHLSCVVSKLGLNDLLHLAVHFILHLFISIVLQLVLVKSVNGIERHVPFNEIIQCFLHAFVALSQRLDLKSSRPLQLCQLFQNFLDLLAEGSALCAASVGWHAGVELDLTFHVALCQVLDLVSLVVENNLDAIEDALLLFFEIGHNHDIGRNVRQLLRSQHLVQLLKQGFCTAGL